MDGWLKIKTKIDNKEVDKGIAEIENKIRKMQNNNVSLDKQKGALQQELKTYNDLTAKAEKYKNKIEELNAEKESMLKASPKTSIMDSEEYKSIQERIKKIKNEYLETIESIEAKYANVNWNKNNKKNQNRAIMKKNATEQANNKYLPQINQLVTQRENLSVPVPDTSTINSKIDEMKSKYSQTVAEIDKQTPKLSNVEAKLEKIKAKQEENNDKISQYKNKIESIKADKMRKSIDSVGKSLTTNISKLSKMAMGVVGIRTAWGAVRSAINMVGQYNPQIATDFQYMGYCIANIVAPAVQWLVNLLKNALSYINAIVSAWFGINLFSKSSAKNFQKSQSSASKTAKSAKEIQKSTQGFDEMNILQDSSSDGSSSNGSSVSTPSFDLSGMQAEVPKWLQWVIDNKDTIISIFAGISGGLLALKLGFGGIQSLGIGIAIGGIVMLIQDVIKFIKDPSFEGFLNILRDIAIVVAGVAIALRSMACCNSGGYSLNNSRNC